VVVVVSAVAGLWFWFPSCSTVLHQRFFKVGVEMWVLIQSWRKGIPVSLYTCLSLVNQGAFRHILKSLFWRIWILLIFVEETAARVGQG